MLKRRLTLRSGYQPSGSRRQRRRWTCLKVVQRAAIENSIEAYLAYRFATAPLDVLKIRLQLASSSQHSLPVTTLSTFRSILHHEGAFAFWKGNVPASVMYLTYSVLQFSTYRFTAQMLPPNMTPFSASFIAGATAGLAATTISYPLDLLRTRFAASGPGERIYPSLYLAIRQIGASEGLKGFWRGCGATTLTILPNMGIFFSSYEILRKKLPAYNLTLAENVWGSKDAVAGGVASVAAKTAVFPLDVIRKRLQVQGPMRQRHYGNVAETNRIWETGKSIVERGGWRSLYRGLGIGLVKSAPASAVTMWVYERVLMEMQDRRWLGREEAMEAKFL